MRSYKRTSDHLNMAVSHILNCQPAPKRPNTSHPQHLPSSESIGILQRGGLCTHLTIATKVANSATTQMEQRVFSSIFFSHLKNKADEPVLKSAVLMQLSGGMVHDAVSRRCLHHASYTLIK